MLVETAVSLARNEHIVLTTVFPDDVLDTFIREHIFWGLWASLLTWLL